MEYHRDQAVAFSAQQRARISFIQLLPTETLVQILGHVCSEVQFCLLSPEYPSVVVSQVCQRWRDILVSSASLWAPEINISIENLCWPTMIDASVIEEQALKMQYAFDHYVQRSSGRLLDIRFVGSKDYCKDTQARAICRCLAAHAPLWRSVKGMPICILVELHGLVDSPMLERLESLDLDWCRAEEYPFRSELLSLRHAPRLRKVTAPQVYDLDLPFGQLTDIHDNEWMEMGLQLALALQSCLQLESLRLSLASTVWLRGSLSPSALPKLSWLHITCTDLETGVELFTLVDAPCLTHLTLKAAWDGEQEPEAQTNRCTIQVEREEVTLTTIQDFLERSQCRLTYLALISVSLATSFLMELLEELPFLEELEITDGPGQYRWQSDGVCDYDSLDESSSVSLDLFRAMAPAAFKLEGDSAPLLPLLRRFYFEGPIAKAFAEDDMSAILDRLCQSRTDVPLVVVVHGVGTWETGKLWRADQMAVRASA